MSHVIRYVRLAGFAVHEDEVPEGSYLRSYDPDAYGGRGYAEWTLDPRKALLFASAHAATTFWTQQSTVMPLRPDGEPNRPLTAFTVTVEALDAPV